MLPEEERVAWPFYIVCDVSESMHKPYAKQNSELTPYEAMQEALHELVDFCEDHLAVADIAHLGVLTFADETDVAIPLRKMSDGVPVRQLPKGKYTNYANVFTTLSEVVAADISELESRYQKLKRPAVFFITDGMPVVDGESQPTESWLGPLRRLHALTAARQGKEDVRIAVVALGFAGANCENLRLVAQAPGIACVAEAGIASLHELMVSLIESIFVSMVDSAAGGDLVYTPPPGMKLCE